MGRNVVKTAKRRIDILSLLGIFSGFLLLTITALYLNAPVFKTSATDEASSASATVRDVASISVDPTVTLDITPSGTSGGTDSASVDVKVMTNSTVGYTLTMAASGSSANMTSTTSTDVITSTFSGGTTLANMATDSWGYSTDNTTFYKVPVEGSEVTLVDTDTSTADVWNTHTYYFGAKATSSLQSGTYSKEVIFTATAKERPTTFFDITYMHEMSSAICENTPTASSYSITATTPNRTRAEALTGNYIAETVLTDYRDMKTYLVRKYANGECWMAQNLETDFFVSGDSVADGSSNTGTYSTTSTGINTSAISDSSATLGSNNFSKWISYSDITDEDAFTDSSNAYGSGTFYATQNFYGSSYGWADNGTDGARSFSIPAWVSANPSGTFKNYVTKTGSTAGDGYYTFQESSTGEAYQRTGNYYNFAAAKAGYLGTATGESPDNSICPRHWTLPKVGTHLGYVAKSFDNLIRLYYGSDWTNGANNTTLYNWLNGAPLDFWRAGYYDRSHGTVVYRTTYADWWSSNASSSTDANYLTTYLSSGTGYVGAQNSYYRGYGLSVRCVAR